MDVDEARERSERLLIGVAADIIGSGDGVVVAAPPGDGFLARARFTSRVHPTRTVTVNFDDEWLEAVFAMEPNVGICVIDDFRHDEAHAAEHLRELLIVVRAYLRGEGSLESRRGPFGRRRSVLRIEAGGREWVARGSWLGFGRRSAAARGPSEAGRQAP